MSTRFKLRPRNLPFSNYLPITTSQIPNKYNSLTLTPTDCKRFAKCNAPICPLDNELLKRNHLEGEPVCFYLREYAKPHARQNLKGVIPREVFNQVEIVYEHILLHIAPLRKSLLRASKTPSKLGKQSQYKINFAKRTSDYVR